MSGYIMKICAGKYDGNVPEFLVQARSTKTGEYIFVLNHVVVFFFRPTSFCSAGIFPRVEIASRQLFGMQIMGDRSNLFSKSIFSKKIRADKLISWTQWERERKQQAACEGRLRSTTAPLGPSCPPFSAGARARRGAMGPRNVFLGGRGCLFEASPQKSVFWGGIVWMLKHRNIGTV